MSSCPCLSNKKGILASKKVGRTHAQKGAILSGERGPLFVYFKKSPGWNGLNHAECHGVPFLIWGFAGGNHPSPNQSQGRLSVLRSWHRTVKLYIYSLRESIGKATSKIWVPRQNMHLLSPSANSGLVLASAEKGESLPPQDDGGKKGGGGKKGKKPVSVPKKKTALQEAKTAP